MTISPAASDTLLALFRETNTKPADYDAIITGDLATVGSDLLCDLLDKQGYNIYPKHKDCGKMIFNIKEQDVHAGGSGCGCCGSVFSGHILKEMKRGNLNRIILMATGALMNPMTLFQGETIPAIAHAVIISNDEEEFF